MDVTSLYNNMPHEEGVTTACHAYLRQTHGTAMGTKMAVAFANIFMARIEKQILSQSCIKPLFWKRYTRQNREFCDKGI